MHPESEQWQLLHPLSPLLRAGRSLVFVAIALSQSYAVFVDNPFLIPVLVVVVLIASGAYGYVAWRAMRFRRVDQHLELREGVFFRKQSRVPLTRLEAVDISRPLLGRLVGLAEVHVRTAGSDGDMRLRYLSESVAVQLRSSLLQRGTPAEEATSNAREIVRPDVITQLSMRDLLLFNFALPIAPLVALSFVVLLPLAFFDLAAASVPVIAAFAALPGIAFGFAVGIERVWNFQLSEADGGLVVRRGLLNLLTQKFPLHRIQGVRVITPFYWRPFGRSKLLVDIAGYSSGANGEQQTSLLLPIGDKAAVDDVLRRVLPGFALDAVDVIAAPPASRWRSPFFWRTYGVGTTPNYVMSRLGFFRQRLDIVPHRKVQSLRISQGLWQRQLNLGTLHFDTAGNNVNTEARHRTLVQCHDLASASRLADQH